MMHNKIYIQLKYLGIFGDVLSHHHQQSRLNETEDKTQISYTNNLFAKRKMMALFPLSFDRRAKMEGTDNVFPFFHLSVQPRLS